MYKESKPMLSANELIEHLDKKGIKFNMINKNIVTSEGVLNYQTKILQKLKKRIEHHIDYYNTNQLIQTNFRFLNKIIDNWYNIDIIIYII